MSAESPASQRKDRPPPRAGLGQARTFGGNEGGVGPAMEGRCGCGHRPLNPTCRVKTGAPARCAVTTGRPVLRGSSQPQSRPTHDFFFQDALMPLSRKWGA